MREKNRISRGVASIVLLAGIVFSVVARPQTRNEFPLGSYLDGGFTVTFTADGKLIVRDDELIKTLGLYTVDGDQIALRDEEARGECGGVGKYKWKFDGKALTFTKIEDSCKGRARHLTAGPWPRIKEDK